MSIVIATASLLPQDIGDLLSPNPFERRRRRRSVPLHDSISATLTALSLTVTCRSSSTTPSHLCNQVVECVLHPQSPDRPEVRLLPLSGCRVNCTNFTTATDNGKIVSTGYGTEKRHYFPPFFYFLVLTYSNTAACHYKG